MRPCHPHPGTAVAKAARAPRPPTDEDMVRFGFLLPLSVEGRSIRSRGKSRSTIGPAPGAVSPVTLGPGRRAMKGRVCFIAPRVSAGCGSAWTPRTRRCNLVAHGDPRRIGKSPLETLPGVKSPRQYLIIRPRRPRYQCLAGRTITRFAKNVAAPAPPGPAPGGCWLLSSWVRTHSRTHLR